MSEADKMPFMKIKIWFILAILLTSFSSHALEYKTYRFSELSKILGYPSETFFGSSEKEISDLNTYTDQEDPCYQEINGFLRYFPAPYEWYGTGPEQAREMVASIDAIFKRTPPLPSDLIFFRGLTLNFRKNKDFSIGEEFTDLGFVSTSTNVKVAYHFAVEMNKDQPEKKKAIMVMYLGEGTSKASVKGILIDQGEDEIILPHGQKMKIMAQRSSPKKEYDTYLVQICRDQCQSDLPSEMRSFWNHYKLP